MCMHVHNSPTACAFAQLRVAPTAHVQTLCTACGRSAARATCPISRPGPAPPAPTQSPRTQHPTAPAPPTSSVQPTARAPQAVRIPADPAWPSCAAAATAVSDAQPPRRAPRGGRGAAQGTHLNGTRVTAPPPTAASEGRCRRCTRAATSVPSSTKETAAARIHAASSLAGSGKSSASAPASKPRTRASRARAATAGAALGRSTKPRRAMSSAAARQYHISAAACARSKYSGPRSAQRASGHAATHVCSSAASAPSSACPGIGQPNAGRAGSSFSDHSRTPTRSHHTASSSVDGRCEGAATGCMAPSSSAEAAGSQPALCACCRSWGVSAHAPSSAAHHARSARSASASSVASAKRRSASMENTRCST